MPNKIYCLVLNYKNHLDTQRCVSKLLESDIPKNTQIIILDNSPTNESAKYLQAKFPNILIKKNRNNLGFAVGNNVGIRIALKNKASHILIINPDVTVGKIFFNPLLKSLQQNKEVGLIAPAIKHKQNNLTFYGLEGYIDWSKTKARHINVQKKPTGEVRFGDFVTFACVLVKAEVFRNSGLIDERYFMYLEDVDYCLTASKKGYRSAINTDVVVGHKTSSSFKKPTDKLKISFVSQIKFIFKWLSLPSNIIPLFYNLLFYPYLYLLWTVHYYRHKND